MKSGPYRKRHQLFSFIFTGFNAEFIANAVCVAIRDEETSDVTRSPTIAQTPLDRTQIK